MIEIRKRLGKVKDRRKKARTILSPAKRCFGLGTKKESEDICNSMIIKFMTYSDVELSKMLFLIDLKIFSGMTRYSMHPHRIERAQNRCRFYEQYMQRFNSFILWYVYMIIKMQDAPSRANLIQKLIKLVRKMSEGPDFLNFEAIEHIKMALNSNIVSRLQGTRNILKHTLKGKDKECYDGIHVSGSADFAVVFHQLKSVQVPCVPFFQKFIQFIVTKDSVWRTMINDSPHSERNRYINFDKLVILSDTLNILTRLQKSESSVVFMNLHKELQSNELYCFLSKDFLRFMSGALGIESMSFDDLESALRKLAKDLH